MKILVVSGVAPFFRGGDDELAENLVKNLILFGHKAEIVRLPFRDNPVAAVPSQMLFARSLELQSVDRVIALKFPASLVRHPAKTIWLLDQFGQTCDLFDMEQSNDSTAAGSELRNLIKNANIEAFDESRAVFCNSTITRNLLEKHNKRSVEVLLSPVIDPEYFQGGASRGYVLAAGLISNAKRLHLIVAAMAHVTAEAKLIVAGPLEDPDYGKYLHRLAMLSGASERITFDLRPLPKSDYVDYVNNCSAIAYFPKNMGHLGYLSMQGAMARKPLITGTDSGGLLELAETGATGWVVPPTPEAVGLAISEALGNPSKTQSLGENIYDRLLGLETSWPLAIERLLAGP